MNNVKIKHIILSALVLVCLVSNLLTDYFMMNYYDDINIERSIEYGRNSVYLNAKIIEQWIDEKVVLLNDLKKKLKNQSIDEEEEISELLREYADLTTRYNSFYIGTENTEFIDGEGWEPSETYIVSSRPWYSSGKNSGDNGALSLYYDVCLNREVIGISLNANLKDRDCVIGSNIEIDEIVHLLNDIDYFDTGFGFIVNDSNDLMVTPSDISEEDRQLIDKIVKRNHISESSEYKSIINEAEYTIISEYIEKYGWNLVLIAKTNEFNSYQEDLLKKVNSIFLSILLMVMLFSFYLSRKISNPIEDLIEKVRGIAVGEFHNSVLINSNWEIGKLSVQLENMRLRVLRILEKMELESELLSINHQNLEEYLDNTKKGTATFVSLLSHDIKTPVTLIKGYATGLKKGIAKTEEKKEQYLDNIISRADQIEKILTSNLDNVHHINNEVILYEKNIEVNDFLTTIESFCRSYIDACDRKFVTDINVKNRLGHIDIDIIKIQRVIDNLLSNAVKFSEAGTSIKLIMNDESKRLFVAIENEGHGIREGNINKIFDMFYRADSDQKGYGLGLSVCRSIVVAHDGEMYVQNKSEGVIIGFYLNYKSEI